MTLSEAFRYLLRHPLRVLLVHFNWKTAVFSTLLRCAIYFFTNLSAGPDAAAAALVTEVSYRAILVGLEGALTQTFRQVEPAWQATAGAAPNAEPCWTESSGACVGQTWLRPGHAREVILVWEARALGNAECAFTLQGRQSGGDGALVSIVHNGVRISGPDGEVVKRLSRNAG